MLTVGPQPIRAGIHLSAIIPPTGVCQRLAKLAAGLPPIAHDVSTGVALYALPLATSNSPSLACFTMPVTRKMLICSGNGRAPAVQDALTDMGRCQRGASWRDKLGPQPMLVLVGRNAVLPIKSS